MATMLPLLLPPSPPRALSPRGWWWNPVKNRGCWEFGNLGLCNLEEGEAIFFICGEFLQWGWLDCAVNGGGGGGSMNMARSGDVSRCHRCGLWSNGSAPITVSASITMRSSRVTAHAVYLDYPTRTEQKNGGNLVVMRPDRRRPRDDFFKGEGGGGSLVVVQPDRDRRPQDDFGRAAADSEKDVSPIHAKPRKPLDQNPEGMDVAGFSKHGGKCYADNLRRYCNSGKLIQACCVIDEMVLHGQIPETKCCVRIIRGLVKTRQGKQS
ncbi:hypothetical protein OsI_34029 [Oryza sativa Indica Group]|uniref:Pentatricopeptide repeat-containing protein n=1 Tax=Oryza sativa subsp. indica TaxID=39946 RepID=B8BHG5_ORYSI|nr:hypothetical protein OsI_34029 [Oryza sativa Indica Group]